MAKPSPCLGAARLVSHVRGNDGVISGNGGEMKKESR
jgi:hypothetical protein